MELPASYFEPDCEPDFPFVDEELYYQTKDTIDEAQHLLEQLRDELYDETVNFDRDCVHEIMNQLSEILDFNVPSIDNLKL